jgi:hypothetical protein
MLNIVAIPLGEIDTQNYNTLLQTLQNKRKLEYDVLDWVSI